MRILYLIAIFALLGSFIWMVKDPSFGPCLAILGATFILVWPLIVEAARSGKQVEERPEVDQQVE